MSFDAEKIKQLMALIHDTDIATIEVCDGDQSIRLERFTQKVFSEVHQTAVSNIAAKENKIETPLISVGHAINSPMVGIVYLAPAPDSAPFVAIGQAVKKGQVLCIIEAMKMMNQIEADRAGVILQLLVENGQPIEFGQPLFVIE